MPSSNLERQKNAFLNTEIRNSHALNQIAKSNAKCQYGTPEIALKRSVRFITLENTSLNGAITFSLLKHFGFNLKQPLDVVKTIEFSNI